MNPFAVLALALAMAVQAQIPAAPVPPSAAARGDLIAPQDQLKITVVGEADLTVQVRVRADGLIPFPFINTIRAGGLTIAQFRDKLTAELADGWLKDPMVRVELDRVKMNSVIVRGVVRAPGRYDYTGSRTLLEVLADAGLQLAQAGNDVKVIRPDRSDKAETESGYRGGQESGASEADSEIFTVNLQDPVASQAFQLQDGDIVTVPEIQTFYISGAVRSAGNYVWRRGLTLGEAVSLAGGLEDRGTLRGASAVRTTGEKQAVVKLSSSDVIEADDHITIGRRLF